MSNTKEKAPFYAPSDTFIHRHIGPNEQEVQDMLQVLGYQSLDELADAVVPESIRLQRPLALGKARGEFEFLQEVKKIAQQNQVYRSLIGMGYNGCITPPVIQRNILENPGWYTQYTPYQAEISQGRLEALLNFQTMISDLTGLPLANSSLLDEATAAAEAMAMSYAIARRKKKGFFISENCHPQTIACVQTRAKPLDIKIYVGSVEEINHSEQDLFGVLVQYPDTNGGVHDFSQLISDAHENKALVTMSADLLALTMLKPPGEWGADIAIGTTQRFGVPMGFGGPHAGYMSTKSAYKRQIPGRLIGVSKDKQGKQGYRLSLQTREQHIRRDRATSNICTAQVLLAIMAGMYATYHGPKGLRKIAERVHGLTKLLAFGLQELGFDIGDKPFFDTLRIRGNSSQMQTYYDQAQKRGFNLRLFGGNSLGISLDEVSTLKEVEILLNVFAGTRILPFKFEEKAKDIDPNFKGKWARTSEYLTHPVFNIYHSEHELLRYLNRLQSRDLSLVNSMIPLGSCTMKLNGTSEMMPITWPEFAKLHPFAPAGQSKGYQFLFKQLEGWLAEITGFAAMSLQPNAGSQGEYAGLLVIRAYHESQGQSHRNICLIPTSAHGTNPASAVMAGMKVVAVSCDELGNIDFADLKDKATKHKDDLAALMITYPSTHGVFESDVKEICEAIHQNGGKVYMDGANMNAQVGLCRPGDIGADVCHLNLHKTFAIPHGGGGPGVGPIGVTKELTPFLPGHPVTGLGGKDAIGVIAAAPYGSSSILPISWIYIGLMGEEGMKRATQVAILNANYMAKKLEGHYTLLYTGKNGRVGHEFILDFRGFKAETKIEVVDVAKRLMDYGYHAPTMSFPVPGTLMIEPTESESKIELDRFCDAMIKIRQEIQAIADGKADLEQNVLKNAPHTLEVVTATEWNFPYSREQAAFPYAWNREFKFWPNVGRIDDAFGDRNLICTCPTMDEYV